MEPLTQFGFTDTQEWPDWRLEARLDCLMDNDENVKYGALRKAMIAREIAHLCFELEFRYEKPLD